MTCSLQFFSLFCFSVFRMLTSACVGIPEAQCLNQHTLVSLCINLAWMPDKLVGAAVALLHLFYLLHNEIFIGYKSHLTAIPDFIHFISNK